MLHFILPLLFVLATARAPLYGTENPFKIADEYIVIYNWDIGSDVILAHQASLTVNLIHTYNISSMFRGFAAHLNPDELNRVLDTPFVKEVHANGIENGFCDTTQDPVYTWGLARICQEGHRNGEALPEVYHYSSQYQGQNTYLYVLDTGTNAVHNEFQPGRVREGANFIPNEPPANIDQHGHGTHCAGTAAGNSYGIARRAHIIPIKVLSRTGSGATSGVIAGVNWAAEQHADNGGPSVCSMSLGSTADGGKNAAITAAYHQGVFTAVAAGNNNGNACNYYPASCPEACTVGATDINPSGNDQRSSFSNYGNCVDVFAPGTSIPSAGISSPSAITVMSGTSMACPHVAGVACVIYSEHPNWTPAQVDQEIKTRANEGVITNPGAGSPNLLLYTCN